MMVKGTTLPADGAGWPRTAGDREKPETPKWVPERLLAARDTGGEDAAALHFRPPTRIYPGL
jgi:hypothetical protein